MGSSKDGQSTVNPPLVLNASVIARFHTVLAYSAFSVALGLGLLLHYKKIVKNSIAGYPQEWFPSVSATIGDWYPERNVFQILIAITSGPRFAFVCFLYYIQRSAESTLPTFVFASGIIRTLCCGGWVYITSSDDHDIHDIFMISYIVLNIPWMIGGIYTTSKDCTSVRKKRIIVASSFFLTIIPLIYFFVQHKVHRIPGAYTHYSFFEWGLIVLDVLYDALSEEEFKVHHLQISIGDLSSANVNGNTGPSAVKYIHISNSPSPQEKPEVPKAKFTAPQTWKTTFSSVTADWRPCFSFLSDLYLSYIFWSIFTSLHPTLFYFSVWELGIAGHELALLSVLSPIWLSITPLASWASTRGGMTTFHLLSSAGLAAYLLDKPLHRLFVVAFATSATVIPQVLMWRKNPSYQSILIGLGLILSSALKHANHSNNPVWPIIDDRSGGYNKSGLLLALLSLVEFYSRPPTYEQEITNAEKSDSVEPRTHWLVGAIPLGGLMFSLHSLLSDPSILVAWSWTGFQDGRAKGPQPNLHGSLTLICQSVGLVFAIQALRSSRLDVLAHPVWFACGCAGSYVMYNYRDWPGYAGGLATSIFVMTSIPVVFHCASITNSLAKTFFVAMLLYCLFILASVWTVAYAFVPGGIYLRERTDLVVFAQMACLSLAFRWPVFKRQRILSSLSASVASYSRTTVACISVFAVLMTLYRLPTKAPQPFRTGPRMLRTGIWTIHFGIDNEGRDSQRRVMNLIKDMELDVVGLLETDLYRTVFGNRDLTRVIVEDMGYNVDLGPGPNSHTWGCVLLSKFPIINSTHHLLPSPYGELAPAIEAVLDVHGTPVTVVVSHNGQEEDAIDRELQSKELARIMAASYPQPIIFLGYVVTRPHAPRPAPYRFMIEDGRVHDVDEDDLDRWCEYIFYRGLYRTSYARLSRGTITDTELQVAQFILPKHGHSVTNDTREARYLRSFKENLSEDHWFPMAYYGNDRRGGVNGHFYHVFNTPLYYKLPENAVL